MKLFKRMLSGFALAVVLMGFGGERASAFGFSCITSGAATDCGIAETQVTGQFQTYGANQIELLISNALGGAQSTVGQVYIEDGQELISGIASLLSVASVNGVSFSSPASPGDLPGGNDPGVNFTADFSAGANPPPAKNGVDPGETLGIVLNVFDSNLSDFLAALADGDLRVGIHVINFADGGSVSLVNGGGGGGTPIPEPSAALVFGAGALIVGSALRRRTG